MAELETIVVMALSYVSDKSRKVGPVLLDIAKLLHGEFKARF